MAKGGKGYGSPNSPAPGRGEWSVKENPVSVPKKGSSLGLTSLSSHNGKVKPLMKEQASMESNKGSL